MLCLKRMTYFNEFIRDTIDDRIIGPGEYYYVEVDDSTYEKTGLIISAEHYWELKDQYQQDNFDETYYNRMESEKEYKEALRQAEMKYREHQVLNLNRLQDIR